MEKNTQGHPHRPVWAYGYEIAPSVERGRLAAIERLVEEEHSNARRGARTWEGRLVVEEQVTHILVVSDDPDQDLEVNRKLEAELKRLDAAFVMTAPLEFVRLTAATPPL